MKKMKVSNSETEIRVFFDNCPDKIKMEFMKCFSDLLSKLSGKYHIFITPVKKNDD